MAVALEAITTSGSGMNLVVDNQQTALLFNHHFLQTYSVRFPFFSFLINLFFIEE